LFTWLLTIKAQNVCSELWKKHFKNKKTSLPQLA
jgi:hypothetical protein